jgi:hypothetical protein
VATYGDLQAQIASDLRRSNLGPEIATAILDAIYDHGNERFWFNDAGRYSFYTIAGQDTYVIFSQPPIQEFIMVDMVRSQIGNTWYGLQRETPDEMEVDYAAPTQGQPISWSINNNHLRLFPMPNAVYLVWVFGHYRFIPLNTNLDSNDWTIAAKNLIRYSALKRLFTYPIRDQQQMQSAEAAEIQELEYLRRQTERRQRSGQMVPYYG